MMAAFPLGFTDVVPDQTLFEKWKEFTLNIGGTQSTLQGVKLPESAGGHIYKDGNKVYTQNRFIYWRVCHDILELAEHSLDLNLSDNQVRYRFQDAPILSSGVAIEETSQHVIVMVPTVCSVHRLIFPHPSALHGEDEIFHDGLDMSIPSIFEDATISSACDPDNIYVINNNSAANLPPPQSAACCVISQTECLYALGYSDGQVQMILLGSKGGESKMMKKGSLINRVFGGLMSGVLRNKPEISHAVVNMTLHVYNPHDPILFSLGIDNKLLTWSYNSGECVHAKNVAEQGALIAHQAAKQYGLCKFIHPVSGIVYLSVFLALEEARKFIVYRVDRNGPFHFTFDMLDVAISIENDLVGFSLGPTHIWALWTSSHGQTSLQYHQVTRMIEKEDSDTDEPHKKRIRLNRHRSPDSAMPNNSKSSKRVTFKDEVMINEMWQCVFLQPSIDSEAICEDPSLDPHIFFSNCVFKPGLFSLQTIAKALSIYRRSSFIIETNLSLDNLRLSVTAAVESEIQRETGDFELSDEEFNEIAANCWNELYSRCIEYHQTSMKPMGLMVGMSLMYVIHKSTISLLRPVDTLEYLNQDAPRQERFYQEDDGVLKDMMLVVKMVSIVREILNKEHMLVFKQELFRCKKPDEVAKEIAKSVLSDLDVQEMEILEARRVFLESLDVLLVDVGDLVEALNQLVLSLSLHFTATEEAYIFDDEDEETPTIGIFSSTLGLSIMTESIKQVMEKRFEFCRDMLLLINIIIDNNLVESELQALLTSESIPHTMLLTTAYYVLVWLSQTPTTIIHSSVLEAGHRNLAKFYGNTSIDACLGKYTALFRNCQRPMTLIELFLHGEGGCKSRQMLARIRRGDNALSNAISLITYCMKFLWPTNNNFIFPEFLMFSCQYTQIQEYMRLQEKWSTVNVGARKFALGWSLLNIGEVELAYVQLIAASPHVHSDNFLSLCVLPDAEQVVSPESAAVLFFIKVINLLDLFDHSFFIVEVANEAIDSAKEDDPHLSLLWTIKFKHQLQIGNYSNAYDSVIKNPDPDRTKNCLREFLVTMFEKKEWAKLISFHYEDDICEVENIFETRARSSDVIHSNYYDFLYAFHMEKGSTRKAATIMYEQALRFREEFRGVFSLKKQASSLLACINALKLGDVRYAWIIKPDWKPDNSQTPPVIPKYTFDGGEIPIQLKKNLMEVLSITDLEKQHALTCASLLLIPRYQELEQDKSIAPEDAVILLTNINLYNDALKICKYFKLSYVSVIDGLAIKCVQITEGYGVDEHEIWDWLSKNDAAAFPVRDSGTICDLAWILLQYHVQRLEKNSQSVLHRAVAIRLLSLGAFLPNWLIVSYKKRHVSELLLIYLRFGLLEDATLLALSYIDAVLGIGRKEEFGLKSILHSNSPPVKMPYTCLDHILLELKFYYDPPEGKTDEVNDEDKQLYAQLYCDLSDKIQEYFERLRQTSIDAVQLDCVQMKLS